jgi:protein gp37
MSDLFHEDVPDEFLDRVFAVMALAPQHLFMVLTKRPERMRAYFNDEHVWARIEVAARILYRPQQIAGKMLIGPLRNLWLGVSVEDQQRADERVPLLLDTPAAVRFVSYEPALRAVDFRNFLYPAVRQTEPNMPGVPIPALDWVIIGGESGPRARLFDLAWARRLIEHCREAGVSLFVKQLGLKTVENLHPPGIFRNIPHHNRHGSDLSEWPEDLRVREFPALV